MRSGSNTSTIIDTEVRLQVQKVPEEEEKRNEKQYQQQQQQQQQQLVCPMP